MFPGWQGYKSIYIVLINMMNSDSIQNWVQLNTFVTCEYFWLNDEDDTAEQQETGEYLIQALDEDRLSDRKLFPSELKGVTW